LGSTRALTNSQAAVTDRYSYDAFGQLLSSSGTTVNSFLYTGEQKDDAAGLYYLRARNYDPALGRFMSQDPHQGTLQEPSSLNRYVYVQNNPVNMTDPTGRYGWEEGTAIHQILGQHYISVWGDFFVRVFRHRSNRGFELPTGLGFPGWGAYNRSIKFGLPSMGFRPDIRNYLTGDVYEIKPLSPYGVASGPAEALLYAGALNASEAIYGPWLPGGTTFEPVLVLPYPDGPHKTVEAFSYPFIPLFGTVLYTDNLERDLLSPALAVSAHRLGVLAARRLQMMAPRLIATAARAGAAYLETAFGIAPVTAKYAH